LIYARDPRDPVKQQEARALTANLTGGALLWQFACEFIAASRKLTAVGYTQAHAWGELEQLRVLWKLIVPSENVFVRAEELTASHNLSFWDAMIIAACMEGSITRLYSEDFDNSLTQATGVEIVKPF
jgi:predicted nucleic acid-binding protein